MATPAFIETNTGQLISTVGLSITYERFIISFKVAGVLVGNETYPTPAEAQAKYQQYLTALIGGGGVTITSVVPDNGNPIDHTVGDTIQVFGTNFLPTCQAVAADGSNATQLISPVFVDSTHFSVTLPPNVLPISTFSLIYYDASDQTAILDAAFSTN